MKLRALEALFFINKSIKELKEKMSRLTGNEVVDLMEAYQSIYTPQELTEEQVWEEVEDWVNSLLEEGYDLSDYTWEDMYSLYEDEIGRFFNAFGRGVRNVGGKVLRGAQDVVGAGLQGLTGTRTTSTNPLAQAVNTVGRINPVTTPYRGSSRFGLGLLGINPYEKGGGGGTPPTTSSGGGGGGTRPAATGPLVKGGPNSSVPLMGPWLKGGLNTATGIVGSVTSPTTRSGGGGGGTPPTTSSGGGGGGTPPATRSGGGGGGTPPATRSGGGGGGTPPAAPAAAAARPVPTQLGPTGKPLVGGIERRTPTAAELAAAQAARRAAAAAPAAGSSPAPATTTAATAAAPSTSAATSGSVAPATAAIAAARRPIVSQPSGPLIPGREAGVQRNIQRARVTPQTTEKKIKPQPTATPPAAPAPLKSDLDLFDIIKGHLLDEGYADCDESAIAIMSSMSEDWMQSILDEGHMEISPEKHARMFARYQKIKKAARKSGGKGPDRLKLIRMSPVLDASAENLRRKASEG